MEPQVERYAFRIRCRGETATCGARILVEGGRYSLQMWMRSPEQPNVLLEVQPVRSRQALWPLFRKICAYRGVDLIEHRRDHGTHKDDWKPVPS